MSPRASLLGMGAGPRLTAAILLVACVWLMVWWALG